jgi:hypothetical protein
MCTTCGVEGPRHQTALQESLAARNPKPLMAKAREAGRHEGLLNGVQIGRRQAVEALAEREVVVRRREVEATRRPFEKEQDRELEMGA